ncbi:hypothetical protein Sme01_38900 [Sphaerisporangium melleum]|uniref:DALR anticodon binding domain-containing protein n=1 Tax=Sphaerisporangium melleum TaxID=321316 RepID=A0A917R387_9ACTN|nr:DALR anticodon-binding domain-containing protein [Sphaerisporangium melleum]GGK85696.1 hypothetical protein GCM10007964_30320 [Sphaerisporangium melleum]GII71414.1 hypothetical protein Sme01_38900 [Sphaerisporangium melleum]
MKALRDVLGAPPVPDGSWEREAVYVSPAALRLGRLKGREGAPVLEVAEGLAARVRAVPGVRAVRVRPPGFLVIEVAVPGEIVREILAETAVGPRPALPSERVAIGPDDAGPAVRGSSVWADAPRTWGNPGFVVRYAYVRAGWVQRWARDLGMTAVSGDGSGARATRVSRDQWGDPGGPGEGGGFRPELLGDPRDRAVLRVLAELPSRRAERDPARGRRPGGGREEPGRGAGWVAYLERLAETYHDAFEHAPALPKGGEEPTATHVARLWMAQAVRKVLGEGLTGLGVAPPAKI